MPAPGSVWAPNTWSDDAWAADTWADAEEATAASESSTVGGPFGYFYGILFFLIDILTRG